jgi:hypothetical protein
MILLSELSPTRHAHVMAALAAVETTNSPVRESEYPALREPDLRECVSRCLEEAGRTLLRTDEGFTSGYADDVREALADEGIGILEPDDRAVLVLVLLHCVAIPRAKGRIMGTGWAQGVPVPRGELLVSNVGNTVVRDSLRRLEERRLIRYVTRHKLVTPGPQLARLTADASARLWEDLVLLAEPEGVMAEVIRRRRRNAGLTNGVTGA